MWYVCVFCVRFAFCVCVSKCSFVVCCLLCVCVGCARCVCVGVSFICVVCCVCFVLCFFCACLCICNGAWLVASAARSAQRTLASIQRIHPRAHLAFTHARAHAACAECLIQHVRQVLSYVYYSLSRVRDTSTPCCFCPTKCPLREDISYAASLGAEGLGLAQVNPDIASCWRCVRQRVLH